MAEKLKWLNGLQITVDEDPFIVKKKLYESSYQNLTFTQNNDFNDISVAKI